MCMTPMLTTPTFITEVYHAFTTVLNDCKCELMAYTALARLVCTTRINAKATLTNDIDYSCHMKAVELV